ncbi:MAG: biopolymer transporter ExbD [Bdellovibrionaceae bacterium]|nr:biopolymer transporter ExbD [Pseudobdellovibrionaceae bacterium]
MARRAVINEDTENPEMQMSSMADVMTILVFFFMATATDELTNQRAQLELPTAPEAREENVKLGTLVVNIERLTHKITVQDRVYTPEELRPVIYTAREVYEKSGISSAPFRVVIRADVGAPYSKVKQVMLAGGDAGVTDVLFNAHADDVSGQ